MDKPFTQITFDFETAPEEKEIISPVDIVMEDQIAEMIESKEIKLAENLIEENEIIEMEETSPVVINKKTASTRGRRSLKDMGTHADLIGIPDDEILFQKQYYAIGEVAVMFKENQSLIRYWETEFDILQPRKNRKGDRFFRPVDIKNLLLIYDLLRRRKFTIEGAKEYLKKNIKAEEKFALIQSLEKIKTFLLELKASI